MNTATSPQPQPLTATIEITDDAVSHRSTRTGTATTWQLASAIADTTIAATVSIAVDLTHPSDDKELAAAELHECLTWLDLPSKTSRKTALTAPLRLAPYIAIGHTDISVPTYFAHQIVQAWLRQFHHLQHIADSDSSDTPTDVHIDTIHTGTLPETAAYFDVLREHDALDTQTLLRSGLDEHTGAGSPTYDDALLAHTARLVALPPAHRDHANLIAILATLTWNDRTTNPIIDHRVIPTAASALAAGTNTATRPLVDVVLRVAAERAGATS